ncbi:MAG: methyl-accepting chemotaxis protein [Pseudolabrys sp.]
MKVSTKLAAASFVIIALVAAIIGSQVWGSAQVKKATDNVVRRAGLAHAILQAKAGVEAMQVGAFRVELARNSKELAQGQGMVFAGAKEATDAVNDALNRSSLKTTQATLNDFKEKIGDFNDNASNLVGAQQELFNLQQQREQKKNDLAAAVSLEKQIADLKAQASKIALTDMAPVAAGISATAGKLAKAVSGRMDQNAVQAANTLRLVKYVGLGISLPVILLLIGAAFMGNSSIARPLRRLVASLKQMAEGEEVEITGTERGDEIGDTARAVNQIKVMLAEKAHREAEQKAAADKAQAQRDAEQAARTAEEKAEQEKRAAAERAAAMQQAADEFQAAIGSIVNAAVAGDFSQRVDLDGKTGLVLNVGTAINSLCENVAMALDDLVRMLNALSAGDLTQRITADYEGSFALLKDNANMTAERIAGIVSDIKGASREVTNASMEITTSTTDLSQRTEEQAASLEETSASMEEIASTVKKNAENAQQANRSAISTREVAGRGNEVVAQAVDAMAQIEDSSRNISEIIVVIDEIARQTNLLALNAAVEAARAGDAGRGFAVVASEVRSLAQRSSQAAKDIKDLIVNSGGQVKEGVELVNRAGSALTEITDSIKQVADLVSDIAAASAEQSTGIDQVNKALAQMDEVTQQNSALVEENAATAKTLESQARAMDERIAFFRIAKGAGLAPAVLQPAHEDTALAPAELIPVAVHGGGARGRFKRVAGMQKAVGADWQDF